MKSIRSTKPVLLAGLAAILATTAVAQEAGVWFRGTDGQAVRSAQERSPRLEFPAATNLLLGGTALSAPAPFSGPAGPFRLQASDGQIRVCDDAACTTPGAWGATAAPRSGQFVQASRPGPRLPGETVRVGVDGAGLRATFEASARPGAPTFGAFATRTVSPGELAESDLSTFRGWIETDLAVTGGSVRVCPPQGSCGAWSTRGTIRDGDQIQLRGEAGIFGTTRTVTVSAGGAEGAFSVVTREKDEIPAAFAFGTGPTGVNPGTTLASNSVTLTGFDDAPISIVGGQYALNGGAFTASAGTARANDTVQVRLTGGGFGETRTATLTVGGQSASWSATARARDEMPDAFSLGSDSSAEPNTTVLSATATLAGFDGGRILISGHDATYSVNSGAFTSQPGEVRAGDRVQVRMTSGTFGAERQATLTVGNRAAAFVVRSRARDETPAEISFPARTDQTPGAEVLSDMRRLIDHDGVVVLTDAAATLRVCSDSACATALTDWNRGTTVDRGQYIQLRQNAPAAGQTQTATVRYGTLSTTWSVTSLSETFTTHTFTSCGLKGRFGPVLSHCRSAYGTSSWASDTAKFNITTNGQQIWTIPTSGSYRIEAAGAQSGRDRDGSDATRGRGAVISGTFSFTAGEKITIVVGQEGTDNLVSSSAGGGGTFVIRGSTALIVAGGGGGIESSSTRNSSQDASFSTSGKNGGSNGSGCTIAQGGSSGYGGGHFDTGNSGGGGGGFLGDGTQGTCTNTGCWGRSFSAASIGGHARVNEINGGFGGGGAAFGHGGGSGGGGGYSGGASGDNCTGASAGGGGSINTGSSPTNHGLNAGPGYLVITRL